MLLRLVTRTCPEAQAPVVLRGEPSYAPAAKGRVHSMVKVLDKGFVNVSMPWATT